jgi:hypothetical protein
MMPPAISAQSNPFATRWTRPGAIRFDFGGRGTINGLVQRLEECGWRGAIVGPHGSGKSTLVAALLPAFEAAGRTTTLIQLHEGQRRLPEPNRRIDRLARASLLVIDGYEQLGRLRRWHLATQCRRASCGLLVTSHRECGLPVLFRTEPNLSMVERLIGESLPPHGGRICRADIHRAWQRNGQNVREILFELYDVFEARRRL